MTDKDIERDSLADYLAVPFKPFAFDTWMTIISFLGFAGLVIFLADLKEQSDDFPFPKRNYVLLRFMRSLYFAFSGFFAGSLEIKCFTIPTNVAKIGFTFFSFVTVASYVANFGARLVTGNLATQITNIHDVLDLRLKVCVVPYAILGDELMAKYPLFSSDLIVPSTSANVWTNMMQEPIKCKAAIIEEAMWVRAQAGEYAESDCNRAGNFWCIAKEDDGLPDLTRDCSRFTRVGQSLLSMQVAWPVANHLEQPLRKALMEYQQQGRLANKIAEYGGRKPSNACEADDRNFHPGLPADSMYGLIIICSVFFAIALLLWCCELYSGRHISALLGYPDPWLEEKQREYKKFIKQLHGMDVDQQESTPAHDPLEDPREITQIANEVTEVVVGAEDMVFHPERVSFAASPQGHPASNVLNMIDDIDANPRRA